MPTQGHISDIISRTREAAKRILEGVSELEACNAAWNDRALKAFVVDATGADPLAPGYRANSFVGHEGLVKSDITQAFASSLPALRTVMNDIPGKKLEEIST